MRVYKFKVEVIISDLHSVDCLTFFVEIELNSKHHARQQAIAKANKNRKSYGVKSFY